MGLLFGIQGGAPGVGMRWAEFDKGWGGLNPVEHFSTHKPIFL